MNLKQLVRYKIDFSHKSAIVSGALMGVAIFLQVVYFTLVKPLPECNAAELTLNLWFPLVLQLGWIVLLRGIKLDASGIFGIFGAVFCLLLITQSIFAGSLLRILLCIVLYLLAAAVYLAVTGGFLPYRSLAVIAMILPGVVVSLHFASAPKAPELLNLAAACSTFAVALLPATLQKA